ncbi:MAG: hypothetical protein WC977_14270, partial [Anaerovoracaceae bacterium]
MAELYQAFLAVVYEATPAQDYPAGTWTVERARLADPPGALPAAAAVGFQLATARGAPEGTPSILDV